MEDTRVAVVIAAAGGSTRFGPRNKLEQDLGGRPVLLRALEPFANHARVTTTIVAVPPDAEEEFRLRHGDALGIRGATIVAGGKRARWETVQRALEHVPDDVTHVAVHDGARPCATSALIDRVFEAAAVFDAVIPVIEVTSTVKRVSETRERAASDDDLASAILGDAGADATSARRVIETVPRENLVLSQTPQVFRLELLRRAYAQEDLEGPDDATLVERLGEPVRAVPGDPFNVKITTPADLELARLILRAEPEKDRPAHLRF